MMAAFLHCPQIDCLSILVRYLQSECVRIKRPARCQIGDGKLNMAQPNDVERRIKIGCR